jgi:hypothetical protein
MHAFVTYDDIRDAEDAKRELDKTEYAAPAGSRRRQGRCGSRHGIGGWPWADVTEFTALAFCILNQAVLQHPATRRESATKGADGSDSGPCHMFTGTGRCCHIVSPDRDLATVSGDRRRAYL